MPTDDPDPGNLIWKLLLLVLLILINAFFAMSEIAVISLNESKIKKQAEEGHRKARRVLRLITDPAAFLSTIQVGVTLAGFLASASAAQTFVDRFADVLMGWFSAPESARGTLSTVAMVVITLIMSYFSLVFGELVPKRIAMKNPERISFAVTGILLGLKTLMTPVVKVLTWSTNLVVRLFGIDPHEEDRNVTEEEIRLMVDVGEESGVIEESQKEMINNIFEFDDITAGEIMTHRTDITALESTDSIEQAVQVSMAEGFSRIPVYNDDLDNVVGIVYIKDLLGYIGRDVPADATVAAVMRPATFVPESKKCGQLFTEMTEKRVQMAVVVDEYGGTAGIVTMEDLIESIVGNIQDEYDNEEEDIEQLSDTVFTIDGTTNIEEVSELLDRPMPEGPYDTLAGLLLDQLGHIPAPDEHPTVEVAHVQFTVESVDERRIDKVRAEKLPLPAEDEDDED